MTTETHVQSPEFNPSAIISAANTEFRAVINGFLLREEVAVTEDVHSYVYDQLGTQDALGSGHRRIHVAETRQFLRRSAGFGVVEFVDEDKVTLTDQGLLAAAASGLLATRSLAMDVPLISATGYTCHSERTNPTDIHYDIYKTVLEYPNRMIPILDLLGDLGKVDIFRHKYHKHGMQLAHAGMLRTGLRKFGQRHKGHQVRYFMNPSDPDGTKTEFIETFTALYENLRAGNDIQVLGHEQLQSYLQAMERTAQSGKIIVDGLLAAKRLGK